MVYRKNQKVKYRKKPLALWIAVAVLLAVLVGGGIFFLTRSSDDDDKGSRSVARTASPDTKGEQPDEETEDPGTDEQSSENTTPKENEDPSGDTPSTTLKEPSDSLFVSNHRPSLAANPTLKSVCNTTPGASCEITFTKDGVVKTLPAETADSGGAVYWEDWTLQQYGLTTGTWRIEAKATLGTQTKTAVDAINLEVQP